MTFQNYITKVLSYIDCNSTDRKRLKEDLRMTLVNKSDDYGTKDPTQLMGSPRDMALEIIDDQNLKLSEGFEYISPIEILGVPLVHITAKKRVIAKGVLAVGIRSVGLVSFGILSFGLFSMGIVSLGLLLAIGSVSLSGFLSIGAIAASGYLSIGAISVAQIAIGAVAWGDVAVGDVAYGNLALYRTSGEGDVALSIYENKTLLESVLREAVSNNVVFEMIKNIINIM